MSSKIRTGTIKSFVLDKRYGFIVPDERPDPKAEDVIFHLTRCDRTLVIAAGTRVQYTLDGSHKRPRAAIVTAAAEEARDG